MNKQYCIYIMANRYNTVLYTGVTSDLAKRAHQHKQGLGGGFTSMYKTTKLVYYEVFDNSRTAIEREKQIKAGPRQRKIDLVNGMNPAWKDLALEL